jgi:hypothetical protein
MHPALHRVIQARHQGQRKACTEEKSIPEVQRNGTGAEGHPATTSSRLCAWQEKNGEQAPGRPQQEQNIYTGFPGKARSGKHRRQLIF